MPERLQKILAQWGLTSRRKAEQWILAGRVVVNGATAYLGQTADPHIDQIVVDGVALNSIERPRHCYILVHKPIGFICTCYDPQGRMTVLDLLPKSLHQHRGLHIVGRLDADSTGAVLLTNDGALTNTLTHPRHHVAKIYRVWVDGNPSAATLRAWRQGVMLAGRKTLPAVVQVIKQTATQSLLEIVLREGRNRQIRNVAELLGHPVVSLHRVAIGNLRLGSLPVGQYRVLTAVDIMSLRTLAES